MLAVVDPGVGTDRRAVAVEVGDGQSVLVGPDNGLLAAAVAMVGGADRAVELTNPDYHLPAPGPTFAGRDVFAPAAAHLCPGVDLDELGDADRPRPLLPGMLPLTLDEEGASSPRCCGSTASATPSSTSTPTRSSGFGDRVRLRFEDDRAPRCEPTFAELGTGEVGLVVDSYGLLSVALDRRSAADELGAGDAGDPDRRSTT